MKKETAVLTALRRGDGHWEREGSRVTSLFLHDVVLDRGDTIQCPAEAGWKRASVDPEKFRFWVAEFWSGGSKRAELPNMEVYGGVWDEEILE